jgi:predicted nuclease of predicted toxin-antitoxin system
VTLLFDENLSFKLIAAVRADFPGSRHVSDVGLAQADDRAIWRFARDNGYAIVTLDSDFYDMSLIERSPPKVIWLRSTDISTANVAALLNRNLADIATFLADPAVGCLILRDR